MRGNLVFLSLTCLLLIGCRDSNKATSLDEKSLPLKSKIVLDGIHGCVGASPYIVTITQKDSTVTLTLESFEIIIDERSVSIEDFEELWVACCESDIATLKESYGKGLTTGDFRGTFSINVKTKEGKLSGETNLIYGTIEDQKFDNIINKIMEILPPENHLPEFSVTSIDYSELPLESYFMIYRRNRNVKPSSSNFRISQKGTRCDSMFTNLLCDNHEIDLNQYTEFWKKCSEIDLVSLKESTEAVENENGIDEYLSIMVITDKGKYSRDFIVLDQDLKLQRLYQMIIEFAEENPWAD